MIEIIYIHFFSFQEEDVGNEGLDSAEKGEASMETAVVLHEVVEKNHLNLI